MEDSEVLNRFGSELQYLRLNESIAIDSISILSFLKIGIMLDFYTRLYKNSYGDE